MRVQHKRWRACEFIAALSTVLLGCASSASADASCFDLARPLGAGMVVPVHVGSSASGLKEGARGGDYPTFWATVQGDSTRSIADLLKELLNHQTTRPSQASEMKVQDISDPHFLSRQEVHYVVQPFPLIHIRWTENWSVSLLQGTQADPERVLVTYEKAEGTHYIRHLCGQYELTRERLGPQNGRTQIVIYEEASAKSRTEQDTLSGIATSLRQLQTPIH